jgi:ABC-type antimicrobial peptide transport system permease subunit
MKKIISVISNQYLWLFLIIGLAFVLRLYRIDSPIADWHSWRQADTAAVSRSFFKEGFNPFIPKYDDMISVSEGLIVNPNRYRFVEFPIYNTIVYWGYLVNGSVDERIARFVSVLFDRVLPVSIRGDYYAIVAGVSIVVVLLSCWYPARRASALDPLQGLRS